MDNNSSMHEFDDDPPPSLSAAFFSAIVTAAEMDAQHQPQPQVLRATLPTDSTFSDPLESARASAGPGGLSHNAVDMLAAKWMNSKQVAQVAQETGVIPLSGKFSEAEVARLDAAIEKYRSDHQLAEDDVSGIILHKGKNKNHQQFWREISAAVERRPMKHVRMHLQRRFSPLNQLGKWTSNEDETLIQAVADLGQKWTEVSRRVGRTNADCRDRYRNHLADRAVRNSGTWSHEEEKLLKDTVSQMGSQERGCLFWTEVSKRMGRSRGRQQCREKWISMSNSNPNLEAGSSAGQRVLVWK